MNVKQRLPLIAVTVTSILCIAISIFSLKSGWFIVFQNFFYIPIIVACFYYKIQGFAISVTLSCIYFILIIAFTSDPMIIRDAVIRVILFILIAAVITALSIARARAEEALRESEESNSLLLQAAGDGIFGVNTTGHVTFVNPAALRMLGFAAEEMLGQNVHTLIHHSHKDGSNYPLGDCPMYASYTNATVNQMVDEILWRKNGSNFPVEYSSTPVTKDSKVSGAVIIFKDITERKQVEEERERLIAEIEAALSQVRQLEGIIPICAYCKKIRDDQDIWHRVEKYITVHPGAQFSHGICPTCFAEEMKNIKA